MVTTHQPDLFDLCDWLVLEHPLIWVSLRFLHAEPLYQAALTIWQQQGQPDVGGARAV